MRMTNLYFRTPVAPWVKHLACWFHVVKMIRFTVNGSMPFHPSVILVLHTKLHLRLYLILMRSVFVNLDCNLQTAEAKPATATDVGGSAK